MQTHMFIIQSQVLHSYNFYLKPIDSSLGTSENVSGEDPKACTLHLIYFIWIQRFWFGKIKNDTVRKDWKVLLQTSLNILSTIQLLYCVT